MLDGRFLAMRAGLVARGLLDGEHRLTAAGDAYVDELLDGLPREEAPSDPDAPRVRWNWPKRWAA